MVWQVGGALRGCNTDLSEFIESGRAFRTDGMPALLALVRPRVAHVRAWMASMTTTTTMTAEGREKEELLAMARSCLGVLEQAHVL